ncbi:ATP-dependent DNA helicase Hel308 [Nanobdella aerobiophila]|uniref:ATP-dependent DNA helicase Hel308 n=1 Tax=Nanobdella aerobiophila TaxID=2586965 RepID=A0A915SF42_9ARCH|nr:DEAD/DEAH box helicase [Nanobdella aerobiophila]BBL45465.1 ATP-dependent DNA helicase Hel308 [Nanobdella aerobiophila]
MYIKDIKEKIEDELKDYIIDSKHLDKKDPLYQDFKFNNKEINEYLNYINFKLYKHQADALELLYKNKNLIITTPTASGKSHIFRLYIMDNIISHPSRTYLLIYPLRALLYDQYEKFEELIKNFEEYTGKKLNIKMRFILGDLTYNEKEKIIREKPNLILTTIDNLHLYLLKNHDKLFYFFKNLDLIVVDELHSYRGVFGTNSAYTFRRLIRILKYFYKNNIFKVLSLSATLKNPTDFAKKMFDLDFELIDQDYSKRYDRYIISIDPKSSNSRLILRKIIRILLENQLKSLVFIESKKGVELLKNDINEIDKYNKIYPYKASYLKNKRREIEYKFKNNEYIILLTTSALELGIDIGDISTVVNYGIPKDGISSVIQRFGRSGRLSEGLNIMIFKKDALDFYYSNNIKEFFNRIEKNKIDNIPLNLDNEKIIKKHLLYSINEFNRLDKDILSDIEKKYLEDLEKNDLITKIRDPIFGKEYYKIKENIVYSGLRNISDKIYYIVDVDKEEEIIKRVKRRDSLIRMVNMLKGKGKVLEEMDEYAFYEYLLPGMVYYSGGKSIRIRDYYSIDNINFIFFRPELPYIETEPVFYEDVKIINTIGSKKIKDWDVYIGEIKVKKEYIGYIEKYRSGNDFMQNIKYYDKTIIHEFNTKAIWIILPEDYTKSENIYNEYFKEKLEEYIKNKNYNIDTGEIYNFASTINKDFFYEKYRGLATKKIKEIIEDYLNKNYNIKDKILEFLIKKIIDYQASFRSGIHAIEHNIIKISPIVTFVDSQELGGYSYPIHNQTNKPTIFIYEGYESGVGLSEILYNNIEKLIDRSIKSLYSCKCIDGCPRCIYSPKCGNYNEYLDKYSGRFIYKIFLNSKQSI